MKTMNFENGVIGFEVKTIKDIVSAKSLGFYLCNDNEYYFDDVVTKVSEDGIEEERDPTDEEVINRAIDALKDGCTIYATCNLPSGYMAVKAKSTILQSDFYVRQYVYIIQDNQIAKAQVYKVQMVRHYNGSTIGTEIKYEVRWSKSGRTYSAIVSEGNIFDTIEKLTDHLTNNIIG